MVASDGAAQGLLRRIVAEGHELATHTVHHLDLAVQSAEKIEEEIVGVEATVKTVFGAGAPPLTLLRAPFGRPYQSAAGSAAYQKVAPVVARHAVHVGWAIDSNDWQYQNDPDRVYGHVTGLIKTPGQGAYGIVLMHSINPQTVATLPRLIDYMRNNGFVFKQTEDVVRARFGGRSSAELVGMPAPPPGGAVDARPAPDAAAPSTRLDAAAGGGSSGGAGQGGGAGGSVGGSGGVGGTGGGRGGSSGTTDPPRQPPVSGSSGGCSFARISISTPLRSSARASRARSTATASSRPGELARTSMTSLPSSASPGTGSTPYVRTRRSASAAASSGRSRVETGLRALRRRTASSSTRNCERSVTGSPSHASRRASRAVGLR
jgi:uncharacterized membrane protein YgcG